MIKARRSEGSSVRRSRECRGCLREDLDPGDYTVKVIYQVSPCWSYNTWSRELTPFRSGQHQPRLWLVHPLLSHDQTTLLSSKTAKPIPRRSSLKGGKWTRVDLSLSLCVWLGRRGRDCACACRLSVLANTSERDEMAGLISQGRVTIARHLECGIESSMVGY